MLIGNFVTIETDDLGSSLVLPYLNAWFCINQSQKCELFIFFFLKKNELEKIIFITPKHEIVYSSEPLQFNGGLQLII